MSKVALIRNSNQYDFGGAELFPINLAEIIINNGYEPIVLSANKKTIAKAKAASITTKRSPWLPYQNFSGIRILLFPAYLVWILFMTGWYWYFLAKNDIAVAHPQSRDDFIAATFAAKILKLKVIWGDHADLKHIYMNHSVWYKNPVGKLAFFASKYANAVIIESHSEKALIENSLGKNLPKNHRVIHIGVVDSYKPKIRTNKKVVFVSTSRLVKDKGISELIEAFKQLSSANAVLRICGDGPDATKFKAQAKDAPNIEFLGHVDNVVQVLSDSDIFVHPTYHEGFGLSLVEAEMCGLPIIASNVGSIPEIVTSGVNGILAEPKNTEQLASAMKELINNPTKRKKMGSASRQIYLDNFQFDVIVKDSFIPLYEN